MQETVAIIERIRQINTKIQHVELTVKPPLNKALPGQSLLVRVHSGWHPYLREQWWPVSFAPNTLVIERPGDVRYDPGHVVSVLGPVGEPFRFRGRVRHVLLLAFDTPPTLLLSMIPILLNSQASITLVLAGSAITYDTRHLPPEVEVVHGDANLNWPNRVMTIGLVDQIFAVVRPDDESLRFAHVWGAIQTSRAEIPKNYLFGVYNPALPCGAGACQACMIRLKQGTALACTHGPALDLTQVVL